VVWNKYSSIIMIKYLTGECNFMGICNPKYNIGDLVGCEAPLGECHFKIESIKKFWAGFIPTWVYYGMGVSYHKGGMGIFIHQLEG